MIDWMLGGKAGPAGTLVWTAPSWWIAGAVAVAVVAYLAIWRGERSRGALLSEGLLWAAAWIGVIVAVAAPVWVEEEGRQEEARIAVVVDASRSMSVVEGGQPRSEAVDAILSKFDSGRVDIYHFGDELHAGRPTSYDDGGTDIEGALEALADRVAGERLAAVVLITDGLDRGLIRRRFEKEEVPSLPRIPGPLTVYQVGEASDLKDLAVRFVDVGGYAYVHAPFTVHATLDAVGYPGARVKVELLKDDALVKEERVVLNAEGSTVVDFEVTPDKAGRFTYSVRVPTYEDDAVPANNVMSVVVRVVRDRIRVLQVAGAPSWDVKFLRRFLKGDPSVDLVSFFILRTKRDTRDIWDSRELSLIEFPHEQLFTEDLLDFDLVLFQNFDYRPYFQGQTQLLENLHSFVVDSGHAFVMIGGDRSFSLGEYGETKLGAILPVDIASEKTQATEEPFLPTLTPDGLRHPVTRLVADAAENQRWWERLHTMDGSNAGIKGLQDGASMLLGHPTLTLDNGEPLPVLSVREVGEGRTMALTVDSSWRWSLSEAAVGRGNQAYLRFWKGAMRWLIGDPTTARVTVETARENYSLGDDVRMVVRVRDEGFAPMPGAQVVAKVSQGGRETTLEGNAGPEGEVVLTLPAERRGAHRVTLDASYAGEPIGSAETVYAVTSRDPELDEVVPDRAFLARLAAVGGGRYHPPNDFEAPVLDPDAGRTVWDRRELPLWRSPALMGWISTFAGLAWVVRRRAGLR